MSRILLTGFSRFSGVERNPSEALMRAIDAAERPFGGAEVRTAVFDVEYDAGEQQLREAIAGCQPQAVIAFGAAPRRREICVERVAVNLDCSRTPDNAGIVRAGVEIVPGAPPAYWSNLPCAAILASLTEAGIPARHSPSAGGFLCNHVFYLGCHLAEAEVPGLRMGFLHIPLLAESAGEDGIDLETLLEAARLAVAETVAAL